MTQTIDCGCSRRQMIRSLMSGSLMLPAIVSQILAEEARNQVDPLAPKAPHFPGYARDQYPVSQCGAAKRWLMGKLWLGNREPKSPILCRPCAGSALRGEPGLEFRFFARLPPGHASLRRAGTHSGFEPQVAL